MGHDPLHVGLRCPTYKGQLNPVSELPYFSLGEMDQEEDAGFGMDPLKLEPEKPESLAILSPSAQQHSLQQ